MFSGQGAEGKNPLRPVCILGDEESQPNLILKIWLDRSSKANETKAPKFLKKSFFYASN